MRAPDPPWKVLPSDVCELSDALQFLKAVEPADKGLYFRTFSDAKPRPNPDLLAKKYYGTFENTWRGLCAANVSGAGVFVVVNDGGQTAKDIRRARAVFADLDGAPVEPAMKFKLPAHIIVESSRGHWHPYWLVEELPLEMFGPIQKAIANRFGGDSSVSDLPRVMRVPGFWNRKAEPFKSRLIRNGVWRRYTAAEVIEAFEISPGPTQQRIATTSMASFTTVVGEKAIMDLRDALTVLPADDRKEWIDVGSALRSLGEPGRELWFEWSKKSSKFDEGEAVRIWNTLHFDRTSYRSVFARAIALGWVASKTPVGNLSSHQAKVESGFHFNSAHELVSDATPISWLIRKYLQMNTIAALIGPPSCGKTFTALDWACSIATDTPWAGQAVIPGAVFVIAGEGTHGIKLRLKAWQKAKGVSLETAPLFVSNRGLMLADEASALTVLSACEDLANKHAAEPVLIVVDTLARNYGADENSSEDMGKFINNLSLLQRKWECCVLVVHHTGHSENAQERGRGSSAFRGAIDIEFNQKKRGQLITLKSIKVKDGPEPPDVNMELRVIDIDLINDDGEPESSCILDTTAAVMIANMKAATPKQLAAIAALKKMYEVKRGELGLGGNSLDTAEVTLEALRAELLLAGIIGQGKTPSRMAWHQLKGQLVARNMIRVEKSNIVYLP